MRRLTAIVAACGLLFSVWLANWLITRYGPIRVWPTDLLAPAGVYVVGVAFLLRDTVQRFGGQLLAIAAIAVGAGLSAIVSPTLALASAAGFLASEMCGLLVFWLLRGNQAGPRGLTAAVVAASVVAAALDSYVFLSIAFGDLGFFKGQFVAKVTVVVLALPFVVLARRRFPVAA
jgi:uncharacterized PurR-regulated membrane protein YhhQ (DUF165 family)